MATMDMLDRKKVIPSAALRPPLRLKLARRRKLRRIKQLVARGDYDNERRLELAMDRLLDDLLG